MLQYQNVKATHLGAFSIFFFWLACIYDPVGQLFAIKFVAIGMLYVYMGLRFVVLGFPRLLDNLYMFTLALFCIVLPVYGLALSAFRGGFSGGVFSDTSYVSSAVYMGCTLLYVIPAYYQVAYKALVFSLRSLCVVIWIGFLLLSLNIDSGFLDFFVSNGAAYIGSRNYAGIDFFYIYFVASPMLILLLCKECWGFFERKTFRGLALVFFVAGALFFSGTRASIIMSVAAPLIVLLWSKYGAKSLFLWLLMMTLFSPIIAIFDLPLISDMFSAKEASNSEKIGYLSTYLSLLNLPGTLWFGQGFNAHVWSEAVFKMLPEGASKTELTYLEMIRVFGVFGLVALVYVLFKLTSSAKISTSYYPWVGPSVFLYALMSSINPYIFSSNGMLVIGFAAGACLHQRNKIVTCSA